MQSTGQAAAWGWRPCRIHRCLAKRPLWGRSALCAYHQGLGKSANIEGSQASLFGLASIVPYQTPPGTYMLPTAKVSICPRTTSGF